MPAAFRHALLALAFVLDAALTAPAAPLPELALKVTPGPVLEHGGAVRAVAFSPDGRPLATGSDDGAGGVWDAATGRPLTEPAKDTFPVRLLSFRPDGKALLLGAGPGAGPGRLRVHDAATIAPVTPLMMD